MPVVHIWMKKAEYLIKHLLKMSFNEFIINLRLSVIALIKKRQAPPLPYSLSSLQIDAARAFGLSAQQVLDACQNLYEKYQLITYPRSDCRYLPKRAPKRHSICIKIA